MTVWEKTAENPLAETALGACWATTTGFVEQELGFAAPRTGFASPKKNQNKNKMFF